MTKHKGVKVELGALGVLVVPPLNFRSLEVLQDRLANFQAGADRESRDTIVEAAWHALVRNYPELTRDQITDELDLGNMQELMEAVMDVSGLKRKGQEAETAVASDPSTGASSTPT